MMSDVIENGANAAALAAATPNRKQEEALSGFGNACSCETVQPLSTTTITRTFLSNQVSWWPPNSTLAHATSAHHCRKECVARADEISN